MASTLDFVSVKDFIVGTTATDVTTGIIAAFNSVRVTGKTLYFPAGTYLINKTIRVELRVGDKDISVVCDPSAILKANPEPPAFPFLNEPLIKITIAPGPPPITTPGAIHSVTWDGGTIDGRLMPVKTVGNTAPDCLNFGGGDYMNRIYISNLKIIQNNVRLDGRGDSCLFLVGDNININNCIFQGAVDAGIYLSGSDLSGSSFKGERCQISGCTFIECKVGFISKRVYKKHVIDGNFFQNCLTGCCVGAATDTTPLGGRFAVISNNIVNNCPAGIELRESDNSIITGNTVTDSKDWAYKVSRSQNCIVSFNYCGFTSGFIPNAENKGIFLDNSGSTEYFTRNTLVSSNSINDHRWGIYENNNVDYSTIIDNVFNSKVFRSFRVGLPNNGNTLPTNSNYGQKINLVPLSAAPSVAVADRVKATGDIYLNSTTKKLQYYTGAAWVDL